MANPAEDGDDDSEDFLEPAADPSTNDRATEKTREYVPGKGASHADELILSGLALLSNEIPLPARLGKYQIQEQVGRGGMGVVWKALDPDLQRTVAIKVLSPHLAQSSVARRRFQREARAAAAISHPNVLTIHSVEEEGQTPFLVMEYVSGQSLKEYLAERGKLDALEVIRLSAQIAQGLAAAHAGGVIHRDVKPANVMLHEGATRVRLMDFGLARVAFDNSELTSHDHTVGTPAYMAPEQIRGQRIDARADLFSLGCVMYCMVTGHSPFHGKTHAETIHKIIELVPKRLHDINPAIPPVLSEMVEKLLAKDPDHRYQSSLEVADVLRRLMVQLNQAPTDEIVQVLTDRTRSAASSVVTVTKASPPAAFRGGRVVLLASTVLAVAAAFAVWKFWPEGANARPLTSGSSAAHGALPASSNNVATETPVEKLTAITVGSGPNATCATLAEAVRRAAPNCTITVVGPGPLEEAVAVSGTALSGLTLKASPRATWRSPAGASGETHALQLNEVSRVTVEGFDFEVSTNLGRAISFTGSVGDVAITDCDFRHLLPSQKLTLVTVAAAGESPESRVVLRNCRFHGADGQGYCLGASNKKQAGPQVVCEDCFFESPNRHLVVAKSCPKFRLSGCVFLGGHTGVWLECKPWTGDEDFEIVNNTFVGTRYWMSWADSSPDPVVRSSQCKSRLCNNLILGGERTMGSPDQWDAMLAAWTCQANWWERDGTTTATADRNGKLATLHDKLNVPERGDATRPDFLVPAAGSPLLTKGAGGDLPSHIGARRINP